MPGSRRQGAAWEREVGGWLGAGGRGLPGNGTQTAAWEQEAGGCLGTGGRGLT